MRSRLDRIPYGAGNERNPLIQSDEPRDARPSNEVPADLRCLLLGAQLPEERDKRILVAQATVNLGMMYRFLGGLGMTWIQVEDFSAPRQGSPKRVLDAFLKDPAPNKLVYISAHGEPPSGRLHFQWDGTDQRERLEYIYPGFFKKSFGCVGILLQSCFPGPWLWSEDGYFILGTACKAHEPSWGGERGGLFTRWLVGDLRAQEIKSTPQIAKLPLPWSVARAQYPQQQAVPYMMPMPPTHYNHVGHFDVLDTHHLHWQDVAFEEEQRQTDCGGCVLS